MSCILRVSGASLDVDALLTEVALVPDRLWHRHEVRSFMGKVHADSGANFEICDAEVEEFPRQVKEATKYLELNAALISKIVRFPGVQRVVVDFGVYLGEGMAAQFCELPTRFIELAAMANVGVEISVYACSEDGAAKPSR